MIDGSATMRMGFKGRTILMKKHRGLIIGIIAAVIVLAGAATFIIAGDYVVNRIMLMTKSDEGYYKWLSSKQIKRTVNKISLGETAVSALKFFEKKDEGAKSAAGSMDYKVHVTDEFCDMFNLYSFKDIDLKFGYAFSDGVFSAELTPAYGGEDLISAKMSAGIEAKKLFVQIPSYKEDVLDLSSVYDEKIDGEETLGDYLQGILSGEKIAEKAEEKDPKDWSDTFKRYAEFLAGSVGSVKVQKDQTVTIGDEDVDITEVIVLSEGEELKAQLEELIDMLEEDDAFKGSQFSAKDLKALTANIGKETAVKLTEYIDGRTRLIGGEVEISVNSTRVSVEFTGFKEDGEKVGRAVIRLNGLKAATVTFKGSASDDKFRYTIDVEPGTIVKSLIDNYGGLTLGMVYEGTLKKGEFDVILRNTGKEIARFSINVKSEEFKEHLLDTGDKTIYDFGNDSSALMNSPYFNATELVGLALGIVDKINEPFVYDYVDEQLRILIGSDFGLDEVREYYEEGLFDMFNGSGEASATPEGSPSKPDESVPEPVPEPEPEPEKRIEGIISPEPEDYMPKKWDYPTVSEVYSYSHMDLADYAVPGQYIGLKYTIPMSEEITPEVFEAKKQEFLDGFRETYTEDQDGLEVQMGDEIYFDIVPVVSGLLINTYSFTDCYALIGDYAYGEGIDDMIIGMKVGETRDLDITLGEQYGEAFSGYQGTFRLTLKEIDRYIEPSWTEEFVCNCLGFESLDECSDYIMQSIIDETEVSRDDVSAKLLESVYANTRFKAVPEDLYNALRQQYYDSIYDVTYSLGERPEEYFIENGYTLEDFESMMNTDVKNNLNAYCLYAAIAKAEDISITGPELLEMIDHYIAYYEVADFDELMNYQPLDSIVDYMVIDRIYSLLYDSAEISYE